MFSKIITYGLTLSVLTSLVACGKGGFNAASLGDLGQIGQSVDEPSQGGGPTAFQRMQYQGKVSGGNNDGALVVDIDKVNGALLIILPLQVNPLIGAVEGEVASLPGTKFMSYKDDKGATYFAVSVPLRYVIKGASFLTPARLPNGDALPQIASGELPSLALSIPGKNNVKFHIYIGVNVVGVFVSSPFDPYIELHFPIRRGIETIGYLHSIPAKSGFDGGFFLNTQMPVAIANIIDDHFHF